MRLQLIIVLTCIIEGLLAQSLDNQSSEGELVTDTIGLPETGEVEVNFLFGYYQQDGIHSAVTGGLGTEALTDRDFRWILNVPLDTLQNLTIDAGVNFYSSASTDNIDTKVSSASSDDIRTQFHFGYHRQIPKKRWSYSLGWGGSVESDYISTSFDLSWNLVSPNQNQTLDLGAQVFFDNWVLILPEELRRPQVEKPTTERRRSYSLKAGFQQVINARLQAGISAELVYQRGLLSTPFHRVFLSSEDTARLEKLPDDRFKIPLSLRVHYFMQDYLVLRYFLRYYRDNFGINAISVGAEPRFKPGAFLTLYPFYRFHHQTASDYFAPFKQHESSQRYFTSDYDLSGFTSHSFGLGFHWSPLLGIGRFRLFSKDKVTLFKSIDLRYTHYHRSEGLSADLIGLDLGFGGGGRK